LVTWEGGLFEPGSDLLRRTQWAFGKIRADGGRIILNEAGRPYGVPGDQFVRNASQTASGISTVYFQWGRYLRGETPSAANPALGPLASEHTQGIATDTNSPSVFDMTLRAKYFGQAGLKNTISSESWHWAIRGNPTVALTSTAGGNAVSLTSNSIKPTESGFDMPQNWNVNGTIVTIGESFAKVWGNTTDFSYLTNMAAWGAPVVKNMTPDQLTTIVNECNARGASYRK